MPVRLRSAGAVSGATRLLAIGLSACSPGNSINGSMGALTPLAFTQVLLKEQGTSLVLEYANFVDGGGNVPFELTVDTQGEKLNRPVSFLLDGGTDAGTPIGLASRDVVGDERTFSPIAAGYLDFATPISKGQTASGNFFVVFTYQTDGSLGSGRTVYGSFDAVVTQ